MEFKRFRRDASSMFAGKVGTILVNLLNLVILARILTVEDMGRYSLFLMVVNLALMLGLNWSDSSIIRHGREEFVRRGKINQSFWARMYLFGGFLVFFTLLFIVFSGPISHYIGISTPLIILVIGVFWLNGLLNAVYNFYQSIDQMKKSAYVLFIQRLSYLLLLGLMFVVPFSSKLVVSMIFLNLSFLAAVLINLFYFRFDLIKPYKFRADYLKKIWKYSWPQLVGFSGLYIIEYIDLYMINRYMSVADVGIYSIAYNGFLMLNRVIMLLYVVAFPLIVEYKTKSNFERIKKFLQAVPLMQLAWLVLVLVGISVSGLAVRLFFSEKYMAAVPSLNILLVCSMFYFGSICFLPLVNAFDLILYHQIINIGAAVVNIIGDYMLIPIFGIAGAAYGTLIASFLSMVMTLALVTLNRKKILGGVVNQG